MSTRNTKPIPKLTQKDIERFQAHVPEGLSNDVCWPWMGARIIQGLPYGRFHAQGKTRVAHRVAYSIKYDEPLDETLILHTCDNPPCVNWNHLFKGTHKDNTQDMLSKGRWRGGLPLGHPAIVGTRNVKAKLTEDDVRKIRELWPLGKTKQDRINLSKQFGVSLVTVYRVVSRDNWSHIK